MSMQSKYLHIDPFLNAGQAQNMLAIAQSFGSFGTYADEATSDGLGEELPQRFDVGINYLDRGLDGSGNRDTTEVAASRSNYFRETYAYGDEIRASGIEPFLAHPALATNTLFHLLESLLFCRRLRRGGMARGQ